MILVARDMGVYAVRRVLFAIFVASQGIIDESVPYLPFPLLTVWVLRAPRDLKGIKELVAVVVLANDVIRMLLVEYDIL